MADSNPGHAHGSVKDAFDARRLFIEIHERNMPALQAGLEETQSRRLVSEIRAIMRSDPVATDFVTCAPLPGSNCQQFICSMLGPADSPYEAGVFHLMLVLPENYPHEPPFCRFLTKVYHPDIAPDGNFHCETLEGGWCPALTLEKSLVTIISMLTEVSPCEPLALAAAYTMAEDAGRYAATVRSYTLQHATKDPPSVEEARAVGDVMLLEYAARWEGILRTVGR